MRLALERSPRDPARRPAPELLGAINPGYALLLYSRRDCGHHLRRSSQRQNRHWDYARAKLYSDKARMWCWISFIVGIVLGILSFAAQFLITYQAIQQQNVEGMGGF